jgi:hypothetical protein
VRERVLAIRRGGGSVGEAVDMLAGPLAEESADLAPANGNPAGRINAAIRAAWRSGE